MAKVYETGYYGTKVPMNELKPGQLARMDTGELIMMSKSCKHVVNLSDGDVWPHDNVPKDLVTILPPGHKIVLEQY